MDVCSKSTTKKAIKDKKDECECALASENCKQKFGESGINANTCNYHKPSYLRCMRRIDVCSARSIQRNTKEIKDQCDCLMKIDDCKEEFGEPNAEVEICGSLSTSIYRMCLNKINTCSRITIQKAVRDEKDKCECLDAIKDCKKEFGDSDIDLETCKQQMPTYGECLWNKMACSNMTIEQAIKDKLNECECNDATEDCEQEFEDHNTDVETCENLMPKYRSCVKETVCSKMAINKAIAEKDEKYSCDCYRGLDSCEKHLDESKPVINNCLHMPAYQRCVDATSCTDKIKDDANNSTTSTYSCGEFQCDDYLNLCRTPFNDSRPDVYNCLHFNKYSKCLEKTECSSEVIATEHMKSFSTYKCGEHKCKKLLQECSVAIDNSKDDEHNCKRPIDVLSVCIAQGSEENCTHGIREPLLTEVREIYNCGPGPSYSTFFPDPNNRLVID